MVICKYRNHAYLGDTVDLAYRAMLDADDDLGTVPSPGQMEWFSASPVSVIVTIELCVAKPSKKQKGK